MFQLLPVHHLSATGLYIAKSSFAEGKGAFIRPEGVFYLIKLPLGISFNVVSGTTSASPGVEAASIMPQLSIPHIFLGARL